MLYIDKNSDKLFDFLHAQCTWIIGKRHPITDCRNVTIPDTKNIVDIMYPLAGSSSLQGNRINFWQLSQKYVLPDTKCRTKNERNWESSPYHCKKMLKSKKKTHIPWRNIINFVKYFHFRWLFFIIWIIIGCIIFGILSEITFLGKVKLTDWAMCLKIHFKNVISDFNNFLA